MTMTLPRRAAYVGGSGKEDGEPFALGNPAPGAEICRLPAQSGQGREGGRWALELYTQPKNIYVNLR